LLPSDISNRETTMSASALRVEDCRARPTLRVTLSLGEPTVERVREALQDGEAPAAHDVNRLAERVRRLRARGARFAGVALSSFVKAEE